MNQKEQAKELSRQSYSIREIAEKIDASKSTVARWLQESSQNQTVSVQPDPSIELELKRMQLNHELELRKLAQGLIPMPKSLEIFAKCMTTPRSEAVWMRLWSRLLIIPTRQ